MKIVNTATMKELDRRTIEEAGVSGEELMERAGTGIARVAEEWRILGGLSAMSARLLAGGGNNGGDAFVAARVLRGMDWEVEVWATRPAGDYGGETAAHLRRMLDAGVPLRELTREEDWDEAERTAEPVDLLIDGLLGTGTKGAARGLPARAIRYLNAQRRTTMVLAIDIPSGMNGDTGEAEGVAVVADLTVTMALPKAGLLRPRAAAHTGRLDVVDIGIPASYVDEAAGEEGLEFVGREDIASVFPPPRPRAAQKGDFGKLLLVGGAVGMSGALVMAGRAALRGGAGLVTLRVPPEAYTAAAAAAPELMIHPSPEGGDWGLGLYDVLLIGPGLGRSEESRLQVHHLLAERTGTAVVDADALHVLAGEPERIDGTRAATVITPHPGEAAKLLGCAPADIQQDRRAAARELAGRSGAVCILKGAGTLIARPDGALAVNMNGNPGMATGGSGDVLAGLLAALLGQGLDPWDAARAGVFLHGRAGDLAAAGQGEISATAPDLIEELPAALREFTPR
ncbi:bifunctional ADP-dependent NAD(P)H-hydrate dehydratase/NAD(P)H-hydrate epimerase [Kiritimatiella glycovorans]|uniref:Bifunctional NAD(P)H-hydrate repair enzyme n=1 Tax=Kiritimatiella glycovorans TaxID=1307763 RepID=A0A0G3EAC4_9BACT|nr:bifunctional ADP-dependent NAD(P)H-hydrate dehydratase/NAD(P)H-hydrate epimerase [Kiritimatiella glycovorans]AKJ63396.1 Nicotinamide nucleotide repair protein [Kiritimatiella glycovorans]